MAMTIADLREEVQRKFSVDQPVILCKWDRDGIVTERTKVKIVAFHPNHVLVEHNGYKECYTYWDVLKMTTEPERKPITVPANLVKREKGRSYKF